ncbi:hypothetical protein DPEC_G00146230 [Dallia pectoralis]|uniref:Uncharacterized protein n=1 Tax=Dallia pectoralis TaxID=75939 RepID=A0ACC2GNS7_DALPE|nr:hypothetical protein DPEC_G00146230 [Dallia pectoralis]
MKRRKCRETQGEGKCRHWKGYRVAKEVYHCERLQDGKWICQLICGGPKERNWIGHVWCHEPPSVTWSTIDWTADQNTNWSVHRHANCLHTEVPLSVPEENSGLYHPDLTQAASLRSSRLTRRNRRTRSSLVFTVCSVIWCLIGVLSFRLQFGRLSAQLLPPKQQSVGASKPEAGDHPYDSWFCPNLQPGLLSCAG